MRGARRNAFLLAIGVTSFVSGVLGSSGTAKGGECVPPVAQADGPRYFTVTPPAANPGFVAIRMTIDTPGPSCMRYIDLFPGPALAAAGVGRLLDFPVFRTAQEWGSVHVRGLEVIPGATYTVQTDCGTPGAPDLSVGTVVTMPVWGDVAGPFSGARWSAPDGSVDIVADSLAVIDAFRNAPTAPPKEQVDLYPDLPDYIIEILDLVMVLDAFRGLPFPGDCNQNGMPDICDLESGVILNCGTPECAANVDCEDGLFCNGAAACVAGNCAAGVSPCQTGETCDEVHDICEPDGGGPDYVVSGLPLDLRNTPPESGVVTLTLNRIPGNATAIDLALTVFDADFPEEGRLWVNGLYAVTLFGSQGINGNDATTVSLTPYTTDLQLYQLGSNTLTFWHDSTGGYRIEDISLTFVTDDNIPDCVTASDCADGVFCNGLESCSGGSCVAGGNPCRTGETCDEANDQCVSQNQPCLVDADCNDGLFCDGVEVCIGGSCLAGAVPCVPGEVCLEAIDQCVVGSGWAPPIGIPRPSFGIDETHNMYVGASYDFGGGLAPYPDAGNGPYTHYVDNSGSCSDGNNGGFGSPSAPRCTMPDTLGAGSVVEVHGGPYTYGNTVLSWVVTGTASQPVFVRGVDANNRPALRLKRLKVTAQYFVLENFEFDLSSIEILTSRFFSFRYNDIHGRDTGSAISNQGGDDVVIYNNEIYETGITSTRADRHGFYTGRGTERIWVVDNHIHDNQGDGIQFCHLCTDPAPRFVYIGRNLIHDDEENAIDIKVARDVVISENTIYGYFPSADSSGDAIRINDEGAQSNIWILFNEISDATICINPWGAAFKPYVIGNILHDCNLALDADASFAVNNIIYDVGEGIRDAGQVVNNIISNVAGNHILGGTNVHHNLLWQNGSPPSVSGTVCNDCIESDPRFLLSAGRVTGLQPSSPAVDAGDQVDIYQTFLSIYGLDIAFDFVHTPRPLGAAWDIGAFEVP